MRGREGSNRHTKENEQMTDEKSKKEPVEQAQESPEVQQDPAEEKASEPAGKSSAAEKEAKKERKSTSKKPALSQKEIDQLILENADLQASVKENRDNLLLLAAEFENFKKRINKDQLRSKELYKEGMLADLIPVLDDIERALQHHEDDETGKAFTMIRNKLLAYLESYDVVPFVSVGEEFDPDKHDAMLTRADQEQKDNVVLEEFEKGYMVGKKVLRHAKVIVNIIE